MRLRFPGPCVAHQLQRSILNQTRMQEGCQNKEQCDFCHLCEPGEHAAQVCFLVSHASRATARGSNNRHWTL